MDRTSVQPEFLMFPADLEVLALLVDPDDQKQSSRQRLKQVVTLLMVDGHILIS